MRFTKKLILFTFVGILMMSSVACNMIEKTPEAIAKSVVAKVNGEKIIRSDIDKDPRIQQGIIQLKQQYGENYDQVEESKSILKEQKQQVLDGIIAEKLIMQKAKKQKLIPDEKKLNEEVNKRYEQDKKNYAGGDEKKFKEILKSSGVKLEKYKLNLKNSIIIQKVIENVTKNVKVDDNKIKKYYNDNKTKFTEKPNTIDLAHILLKTEEEAKKVKGRLDKGEEFEKLAKELSQDPGSKENGGKYLGVTYDGYYQGSPFDPQFMKGALALKEGQISNPVKTQHGFHIIKCIKKHEYPIKSFEKVKEQIKVQLENKEKQNVFIKKLEEWKKASKIETKKYEKNLI